MNDLIERAKAALEGVTEGPWEQNGNNGVHTPRGKCVAITDGHELMPNGKPVRKANAEFIAAARTLVPGLVAALELCDEALLKLCDSSRELRATNKKLRDALKAAQAENEALLKELDWWRTEGRGDD